MIARNTCKLIMLVALLYSCKARAQDNAVYIDSVNRYQKFVDSLVRDFTINLASNLRHASAEYNCADGRIWGAYAELYRDAKRQVIILTWQSSCDTVFEDKSFYFINNKIVLAMDGVFRGGKREKKYYKNDILIFEDDNWVEDAKPNDKDLAKGYDILKDLTQQLGRKL